MKIRFFIISVAILLATHNLLAQQSSEISVSIKTSDGKYIGMLPMGGLDAVATAVTAKQTFFLIDLNGGKVADGDKIKIRMDASQWHEDKDKALVHRVPIRGANESECLFKLRTTKDKMIYLETPGGKFVKVDNGAIITTGDAKTATLFDIQAAAPPTQATVYTTALKFANGAHIGMVAGGGLDAVAKEITNSHIFQVVDLNGETLKNGDQVKIVFGQSQMREDKDKNIVHRVPIRGAVESECIFKVLVTGGNIRLQAPSGKFVAASADGKSIVTVEAKDASSLITAVPNPTPVTKP